MCGFARFDGAINFISGLLQGLGAGAVMPIATTIIGDIYSTEERAKVQGYLSSVWGISAVSGPAIGGRLLIFGLGVCVLGENSTRHYCDRRIGFFLHEPRGEKKVSIDYKGAILLTFSLSAIYFG